MPISMMQQGIWLTIGGNVGNLLSHNVFAYCMNNPVNISDPSGNWPSLSGIFQGAKKLVNNVVNAIVSNVVKSLTIAAVTLQLHMVYMLQ